jgi:hypothetical protein
MLEQTQTVTLTITEYIAALRDTAFVVGLSILGWKARAWIQPVIDFFKQVKIFIARANEHMNRVENGMSAMENGMNILLDNHMKHVQASLEKLAKDRDEIT